MHPTAAFWGLDKPPESLVDTNPDATSHEIEKFLRLCLKCNPTVMELLWLPDDLYFFKHPAYSNKLLILRHAFLSTKAVQMAYGGYAMSQLTKFRNKENPKRPKLARHCLRLLEQGYHLLKAGELRVKVRTPELYHAIEQMPHA